MSTRAAIYLRISDDPSGKEAGVDRQLADCQARAAKDGLHVDPRHIFSDNDIGASKQSRKARPQYARMLDAAEAGEFDMIIAYSMSRITRRLSEWANLIDLYDRRGVKFLTCVSGDPRLDTADGQMMANFLVSIDAAEAARISERIKRQQEQARSDGRSQGKRPFGWGHYAEGLPDSVGGRAGRRVVLNRDQLNVEEGPALRQGIQDALRGKSLNAIARQWTEEGVKRPGSDDPWLVGLVKTILIRWRNAGVVVHNGVPLEGVEGNWEPVCTREQLDDLRLILLDPNRNQRTGPEPQCLLSGIAVCGSCGRTMVHANDQVRRRVNGERVAIGKIEVYRCSGFSQPVNRCCVTTRLSVADDQVWSSIVDLLTFGPFDGIVPTANEEDRLREIKQELAELSDAQEYVRQMIEISPGQAKGLLSTWAGLSAKRAPLEKDQQRILSGYVLRVLFDTHEGMGLAGMLPEDEYEGDEYTGLIDIRHLVRSMKVADDFEKLAISQRRAVLKQLVHIKILPDKALDRALPQKARPAARIVVTAVHGGRRLNESEQRQATT